MSKHIKLTPEQKDEIRRLTQLANRRIKATERAYRKEGLEILPREVVGKYQVKSRWVTENTPISRTVKFESEEAYRKQLKFLKSFEYQRLGIKEYTKYQREKTVQAVESVAGIVSPNLQAKISKMTAPQLANFWGTFETKANKIGIYYSSDAVLSATVREVFAEDIENIQEI